MLDEDGYPEEEDLKRVETWPREDFVGLMKFVESIWWPDGGKWGWRQRGKVFRLATGGWSGNEDIIDALRHNYMFWARCWHLSRRGGRYIFQLPN